MCILFYLYTYIYFIFIFYFFPFAIAYFTLSFWPGRWAVPDTKPCCSVTTSAAAQQQLAAWAKGAEEMGSGRVSRLYGILRAQPAAGGDVGWMTAPQRSHGWCSCNLQACRFISACPVSTLWSKVLMNSLVSVPPKWPRSWAVGCVNSPQQPHMCSWLPIRGRYGPMRFIRKHSTRLKVS